MSDATTSGVPPRREISSTVFATGCGKMPPADSTKLRIASAAPLRMRIVGCAPFGVKIDTAHARLRGERNKLRLQFVHLARAQSELLFGQHDDAAAFRRFIRQRASCAASARSFRLDARRGMKRRRPCDCRA